MLVDIAPPYTSRLRTHKKVVKDGATVDKEGLCVIHHVNRAEKLVLIVGQEEHDGCLSLLWTS